MNVQQFHLKLVKTRVCLKIFGKNTEFCIVF